MVHKRPAPRFMAARFEPSPLLCRATAFRIRRCCHVCVIAEVMNQFSLSLCRCEHSPNRTAQTKKLGQMHFVEQKKHLLTSERQCLADKRMCLHSLCFRPSSAGFDSLPSCK